MKPGLADLVVFPAISAIRANKRLFWINPIHEKRMAQPLTESPVTFDRKSRDNSRDTVKKLLPAVEMLPPHPTGPRIRRVLGIRLRGEDRGATGCREVAAGSHAVARADLQSTTRFP